jgi:hypothetical protein
LIWCLSYPNAGTDDMIFKIFSRRKIRQKIGVFAKNLIVILVFEKNANYFAENGKKSAHNIDPRLTDLCNYKNLQLAHTSTLYKYVLINFLHICYF